MVLLELYHNFNSFLGTLHGELLTNSIELLIFLLITWMILSEYKSSNRRELKYLVIGFSGFVLSRLIMTFMHGIVIFTDIVEMPFPAAAPIIDSFLEIVALILVGGSFLYPLFRKNMHIIKNYILLSVVIVFCVALLLEILWLNSPLSEFDGFYGYIIFESMKVFFFLFPAFLMILNHNVFGKYWKSLIAAFILYTLTPIINIYNYLIYFSVNPYLIVASHPFTFISVLLFMKVAYLKLVDKASLKERLKKTEEKYHQAEELSKLKDDFVSVVSHELRTPLTSIKLYLSLLLEDKFGKLNKKQTDSITTTKKEADRLTDLINDILDLSKLESGTEKISLKKVNLFSLINSLPFALAENKNIKVKNEVDKKLSINVDERKFYQVLVNLFSNAVKFTDKGYILFSAKENKISWEISVKDTGIGIPPEQIPRLFDKFYQVEHHMTRKKGGTGLGLAIVKKLAEMHNGSIKVKSELGKGTIFTVIIPKPYLSVNFKS